MNRTNIYIDTEFNSFGGELISLALVAETGEEFYEALECKNPHPWVAEHIIPILNKEPISKELFQAALNAFLNSFKEITIIADWPDDIKYFCESLITSPGCAFNHPPISFILDRRLSSGNSEVPHNALHDARAIKKQFKEIL